MAFIDEIKKKARAVKKTIVRSEEHTSELQSH